MIKLNDNLVKNDKIVEILKRKARVSYMCYPDGDHPSWRD